MGKPTTDRREFEMSETDLKTLLEASKPVPYILGSGGVEPIDPQEHANRAWGVLGARMGFDWKTVRASSGGQRFFSALAKAEGQEMVSSGRYLDVVLSRGPGPDSDFVELEDERGRGVGPSRAKQVDRGDGFHVLRIRLEAELEELR